MKVLKGKSLNKVIRYFTKSELIIWATSVALVLISFLIFDRNNVISLIASLIGVTSLIFNAKGNPIGQVLMVIFSLLYGVISYSFHYYGEMVTYLGMTMPMAVFALIAWLRHPFKGNKAEVEINRIKIWEYGLLIFLTIGVTIFFYFILDYFHTANMILSTLSITTSFVAVYLTFRRSPYYAIAYAMNDIILIGLWVYASFYDRTYVSVAACFVAFLINDLYGFFNWKRMEVRQKRK